LLEPISIQLSVGRHVVQAGAAKGGISDVPASDIVSVPLVKGLPAHERNWKALPALPRPDVSEPGACSRKPRLHMFTTFSRLIWYRLPVTFRRAPGRCELPAPKGSGEG